MLLGIFLALATFAICGMTSGMSTGPRLLLADFARGLRTGVGSKEAGWIDADLLGAFLFCTGTRSADSARGFARALAFALGTGMTSGPSRMAAALALALGTGMTSGLSRMAAAPAAAPIVGTGVGGTRALDALARGGGLYWGTTSSSSIGVGACTGPLLLERVALGRGVVALGALALGAPRPNGYVGVSLWPRLGVPMLNWGTTLSIMGVGIAIGVRIAPIDPGGGGGGGPNVTGTPAIGWS